LSFGSRILKKSGLYIAGVFDGKMNKITLKDEYGPLHVYLLPFVKPAVVRAYYDEEIESYNDAVNVIISNEKISMDERNILVAHQFVTSGGVSPERSDSENISLGGLDNVEASLFRNFDYVALGHIHRPQKIGRDEIRYAGSPLKYSFSEARHHKSVTVVDIMEKGNVKIDLIPLLPLRDLREIKGPINELIKTGKEDYKGSTDYIHATITDEDEIYDALGKLRQVYPNIMILDFDNKRSRSNISFEELSSEKIESKSPLDLFGEFYEAQNNKKLSEEEIKIIEKLLEKAGGIEI
jgi:exonuclease SbcD